ncbi:MAG: SUMF1/EgtB/PvdO family nonheme iron enzyme [Microcystaceae cyanobacterium]
MNELSRQQKRQKTIERIVKYAGRGGTGIGVSATIKLCLDGQVWPEAVISLSLTVAVTIGAIAYRFVSGSINRILDKIEAELEAIEEPFATWVVEQIKTGLVKGWWWLNPAFKRKYNESLIDMFRELKVEGFRVGLPALDLEAVFISLRIKTEMLNKIKGKMIASPSDSKGREIWEFLRQSKEKEFYAYRRLAVIGSPGSGKTTLLKHITLTYTKGDYGKYHAPKYIPILLYLRDIRLLILTETPPNLIDLILHQIRSLPADPKLNPPKNWIEDQIRVGNCLIMFDGLDEVANTEERLKVSEWVNQQMTTYSKTPFIVTSRPHGYLENPIDKVGTVLQVLPFNLKQTEDFINNLYRQNEIQRTGRKNPAVLQEAQTLADDLIERIQQNRAIADMAKNPLLVTMIATVHYCGSALPGRRVELYQKICELLLGARQQAKKMKSPLTGEQNKSVLQVLALALMLKKTREFELAEGIEIIKDELQQVAGNELSPKMFFKQIKEVCGLLVEREMGVYEFAHLSFQEYLAAAEIKETQKESILLRNMDNGWWKETIRLYAAQGNGTDLIEYAANHPSVASLTLAVDCLEESLKVSPETREKLDQLLEKGLTSDDPEIVKLATEVKLCRRLDNLLKIDDNLEIDPFYISVAEYKLFLKECFPDQDLASFGTGNHPMIAISNFDNAINFCGWLTEKAKTLTNDENNEDFPVYFRLPYGQEAQTYQARDVHSLGCWTMENQENEFQAIRIVKTDKSCLFSFTTVQVYLQENVMQRQRLTRYYFSESLNSPSEGDINLEMVFIQGGTFWMGSPQGDKNTRSNEYPQHQVTLQPFYMSKYPITQAQWRVIAQRNDLKVERELELNPSHFKGENRPVEKVSWDDAVEFCQRLSRLTGKEYKLPSEAQWEGACRGISPLAPLNKGGSKEVPLFKGDLGGSSPYCFGETLTSELANYGNNVGETTSVGQYPPNGFGLYDMHGNVWEWCEDEYINNYENTPRDGTAYRSKSMQRIVLRGGSWLNYPLLCRSAARFNTSRNLGDDNIGFRVVCVVGETS